MLFPEFDLIIESEDGEDGGAKAKETEEEAESRRQATAKELTDAETSGNSTAGGFTEAELAPFAAIEQDVIFGKFKKGIEKHKDQVDRLAKYNVPFSLYSF